MSDGERTATSPAAYPAVAMNGRVTQAEVHRLLESRDQRRLPRWGEPGFRDPSLMAGSPRTAYLHALALLVAAGADIGAFDQIVQRVMPMQSDQVVWLVVFGFTAVVLYLAHVSGVQLRNAKAEPELIAKPLWVVRFGAWWARRSGAHLCVLVWLALGLVAFWVRLTVAPAGQESVSSAGIGAGGGGGSGGTDNAHNSQAAGIFLALYVGTGLVAAVGAYLTHNPLRGEYVAASRGYRKAYEQASASAYQLAQATAMRDELHRVQNEGVCDETERELVAFAERLKQTARVVIAATAQDPAVTDAIFRPDDRPYREEGPRAKPSPGA